MLPVSAHQGMAMMSCILSVVSQKRIWSHMGRVGWWKSSGFESPELYGSGYRCR